MPKCAGHPVLALLLAISAWPAQAAPPTVSVINIVFSDLDLDSTEIGGDVTWNPSISSEVDSYDVALAENSVGSGTLQVLATGVAKSQGSFSVAANTAMANFTHVVVFTVNADGRQTQPSSVAVVDEVAVISGFFFEDLDLDEGHLGGTVSWILSGTAPVSSYNIYFADKDPVTGQPLGKTLVGSPNASTREFAIPADTPEAGKTLILAFSVSLLGESSTYAFLQVHDEVSPVRNLRFEDLDLDEYHLGGDATWDSPVSTQKVSGIRVYRSPASGTSNTMIGGNLAKTAIRQTVPEGTPVGTSAMLKVYTYSTLAESTTPISITLTDHVASVSGVAFTDLDLDDGELGGVLSWTPPPDTSRVQSYAAYMSQVPGGFPRSGSIGGSAAPLQTDRTLAVDTDRSSYTYFVVFTRSTFVEQTTPVALSIVDANVQVSNLAFADQDLNLDQLGGTLSFTEPADTSRVDHYEAYLYSGAAGVSSMRLGGDLAVGTSSVAVPLNTSKASFTRFRIYTASTLERSDSWASLTVIDVYGLIRNLAFTDTDPDAAQLGGTITWSAPTASSTVTGYRCFLARNSQGLDAQAVGGLVASGPSSLSVTLPLDTAKDSFTHIVCYSESSLGMQAQPAAVPIFDVVRTTSCHTYTCPTGHVARMGSLNCNNGVCTTAQCCYPGCVGSPNLPLGSVMTPCLNATRGSTCSFTCSSGFTRYCPSGNSGCGIVSCTSSGYSWNSWCAGWRTSAWGQCSATCGDGTQSRTVTCNNNNLQSCSAVATIPVLQQACQGDNSQEFWYPWGQCSFAKGWQTFLILLFIFLSFCLFCCCVCACAKVAAGRQIEKLENEESQRAGAASA